jgi:glutamyl-tRNA synthetase
MHTADLGDFVIAKNINEPLFHLAVVVDDFDEGVTHIIRGEDHVSNTPRQILIQRAIGAPTPTYAHLPLVLGEDKQKLSKRKGALAMTEYRDQGYLPEAILNMVSMVGWNSGTNQELFSKEELIKEFDLAKVQKSPAIFNQEKLNWINKEYIKKIEPEILKKEIFQYLPNDLHIDKLIPVIAERIVKFSDISDMLNNKELDFFVNSPKIDKSKLNYKNISEEKTKENIKNVISILESISEFNLENIKEKIMEYANTLPSRGEVLHPMRFALSGLDKSPDPFTIAEILGKNETISRLQKAI